MFPETGFARTPPQPQAPNELLEWARALVAAVGGGFIVKLLDIGYLELRRRDERRKSTTSFVDQHLDPLLKAADELVGKLLSLGREDFRTFAEVDAAAPFAHPDFGSTALPRSNTQVQPVTAAGRQARSNQRPYACVVYDVVV